MTVTLTNPYKKVITFKNRSTQIRVNLSLDQNPQQEGQLGQSKYGPKQTDYDIADGIKRTFIYWFNFGNTSDLLMAMVYRGPSRKYERDTLWQSRNDAFDFPCFSGDLSPVIRDAATLWDVFIIATSQQNLGKNECQGIPRRSGLREHPRLPGMLFAGTFPLPFPNAIGMLNSDKTDWSQACAVRVKLRFTDIASLLRSGLV